MNNSNLSYCGVDVSKKKLDINFKSKLSSYDNTVKGIEKLSKEIKNAHFIFESTGGYERMAAWTLMSKGFKVSIVNPKRIRDYARAMGILAKTDKLDAEVIVKYAITANPRETPLPSEDYRHFCAIMDRRHQLKKMKIAERNRLGTCGDPFMRKSINNSLDYLNNEIIVLEKEMKDIIKNDDEMKRKEQIMQIVCGIGTISAANILAYLPEIGTLNKKEVAALLGVAPYNRDSGPQKGKRHIYGGRAKLRSELYMATISATTYNPHLRAFYFHLRNDNNCPKKVARIAVLRKMIIAVNSLLKNSDFELAS
ncbi:MAG: IS110 family transposase [Candidatus Marinimicrobia bacterium]|nr:IS110 family transposase [Candidatus Neomarinimicrobiota bacterium]